MANDSNAPGGTAAPTTPQGQQPTPSTPPAGAPHAGTNAPQASASTSTGPEIQNPEAYRYAQEAAELRKLVKQHEAEIKRRDDAALTAEQKRERDFSELQTKALDYELRFQKQALQLAAFDLAQSLGISDRRAALALVQSEHATEIKYAADGTPENLEALLKAVLAEHPILAGTPAVSPQNGQQQRPPQTSGGGASNPGRQAGNGGLTMEQIEKMPMREMMRRMDEIDAWKKANPELVRQWAERATHT